MDFAIWWKKTSNGHAEKKNLRLQLEKACGRNVDIVVSPENSTNPLFMEGWKKQGSESSPTKMNERQRAEVLQLLKDMVTNASPRPAQVAE